MGVGMDFRIDWNVISAFSAGISALAATMSTLVILMLFRSRHEFSADQKIGNVAALFHAEYLDRKFDTPLEISFSGSESAETMTTTIREARGSLREHLISAGDQFSDEYCECLKKHWEMSKESGTWQYKFSGELLYGLEELGVNTASGAVPLSLVLAGWAHTILEDYSYTLAHLDYLRGPGMKQIHATGNPALHWRRRHAEWLVHVAVIHLYKYWRCDDTIALIKICNLTIQSSLKREADIRRYEGRLFGRELKQELRHLRKGIGATGGIG
jgi:hypothetical protein